MKKILSLLIAAFMLVGCLSACSNGNAGTTDKDKIQIVTTIFPIYDWVKEILGEDAAGADVTMLLDNGVDLHSYQPTAKDILKISNCDLFIYVGGESDEWVEDSLKETVNSDMTVVNLMQVLGSAVKEEEVVEGMQEEEHDHEESEDHEGEDHEEVEYDEHVWLSLRNAETLVKDISDKLQKIDAAHAEDYKKNTESYVEKLTKLDVEYLAAVKASSQSTILFGDRFPFRYMTDDYDLKYFAAFVGCSAETEASFETVTFLANKVDEFGLKAVMTIEGTDHRIAETIVQNTKTKDQSILTLDSMQSTTSKDVNEGKTYLSIMTDNLGVLKEAL